MWSECGIAQMMVLPVSMCAPVIRWCGCAALHFRGKVAARYSLQGCESVALSLSLGLPWVPAGCLKFNNPFSCKKSQKSFNIFANVFLVSRQWFENPSHPVLSGCTPTLSAMVRKSFVPGTDSATEVATCNPTLSELAHAREENHCLNQRPR
jgi:hypothetical protein